MDPYVSIMFPNFNGSDFVINAIESVVKLDYPQDRFELIIVDNNSSDNSVQLIKEKYLSLIDSTKIKLIELDSNIGAPSAYNIAIKNACRQYDYIFKLDNDIILFKDSLKELVKCAEQDSSIGITGGKVFYYSDKNRLHLIGSKISPFFAGGKGIGKFKVSTGIYDNNMTLDAVNGCMMLVKRKIIEDVGLMDEGYFLYYDDLDWSLRALRKGYKSIYCYKAKALHNTSLPNKRFTSSNWLYYAVFNSFYFMKKNYKGINKFIFFNAINIRIILWFYGVFINNKFITALKLNSIILKAYFKGLKHIFNDK